MHRRTTYPIGTTNTPDAVREILNMPPPGGDTNSSLAASRYYNKADVILLVSNSSVMAVIQQATNDSAKQILVAPYNPTNTNPTNFTLVSSNFPFLSITNIFPEEREHSTVKTTQIDMGKLSSWLLTNPAVVARFPHDSSGVYSSGLYPNIMYVADNRTNSGASNYLFSVRLTNGIAIPTNMSANGTQPTGFSIATPNPLYVAGDYNCPNSSALGTTNTTQTFPASLASDALTILSDSWKDSWPTNLSSRVASATTVNAAILSGIVFSTGSGSTQFSGGVMNLPRLLEDWSGVTLTLNTSIVNLYNSVKATNQFQNPGIYYNAPKSRQFSFDNNFTNYAKLPPGTPMFPVVNRAKWTVPPPNTITYVGQ